jgi:uncharacterized membrane protein
MSRAERIRQIGIALAVADSAMRTRGKRWKKLAATAVIAGAVAPTVLRWLRRTGAARRAVDMRMSVVVERPVAEVFEFCRDFENFPGITDVLLSVEDSQDGRSHWSVRSPSGQTIGWDAVVTKYVPNSVIAWESVPGSVVIAGGLMRFARLSQSETRVDIKLTYRPLRTDLFEAIHALVTPSNTQRLRSELSHASRQMAQTLSPERVTTLSVPPQSNHLSDAPRGDAPTLRPTATEAHHWRATPADETRADPETAP